MISLPEGTVEYQEMGAGPAIVFVPGSFSTGSSWRSLTKPLSERYRTVTTSLSGYGNTQERRKPGGIYIEDEMDVLEAVLAHAGGPVHLVAHSFGAWVALIFAMRRSPELMSLTLLEPTAFNVLAPGGETALNQQVHTMTDRYFADWQGGDQRAVRHVIDFYGGTGTWDSWPSPVQHKVISQTSTNILDWQTGYADSIQLADLSLVTVPTLVVYGATSHLAMRRCNHLLGDHLPHAETSALKGANHFMVSTHAAELTDRIEEHIRRVTQG